MAMEVLDVVLTWFIGDNWIVECDTDDKDGYVYGKTKFYLKHRDTGMYLYTDMSSKFNQ